MEQVIPPVIANKDLRQKTVVLGLGQKCFIFFTTCVKKVILLLLSLVLEPSGLLGCASVLGSENATKFSHMFQWCLVSSSSC